MLNVFGIGSEVCTATESTELLPIKIKNTGDSILTNILVTIVIPPGLDYLSDNPSTGTYDDGTSIWTIASLGVNNEATLDLCFTVTDDTEAPWEITYEAVHDDSIDSIPTDDAAERNIEGLACSEFGECFAILPEYDSMEDAIAALGSGMPFLYSLDNIDGGTYRGLHITPLS